MAKEELMVSKLIRESGNKYYKEIDYINIYEFSKKHNLDAVKMANLVKKRGYKILTD